MRKVWVVKSFEDVGLITVENLIAIFSTEKKAKKFIEESGQCQGIYCAYDYQEYDVE